MIEINLLFFSRSFLMFNCSSEMLVYITFSRIPKCLHLLPFCVAVDASVRHPVPGNEPTKVLLRTFIPIINNKDTLSYSDVFVYHSSSGFYSLFYFSFFLFISSVFRLHTFLSCNIDTQLIQIK